MGSVDNDEEVAHLKETLVDLMSSLGKITTDKELRKAYRENSGVNINVTIDRLGLDNFYNFLRFRCRDICEVYKNDGEVKVQRVFLEKFTSVENLTKVQKKKKQKKNVAPKLNFPRVGIINETSFKGRNPQGVSKGISVNKEQKTSTTTLPFFRSNCSAFYRSADQLVNFHQQDEDDDEVDIDPSTLIYKGRLGNISSIFDLNHENEHFSSGLYSEALKSEVNEKEVIQKFDPPRVQNPFDFPSLPLKAEDNLEHQADRYEEPQPVEANAKVSVEISENWKSIKKEAPRFISRIALDDPLLRSLFAEVVTDSKFVIPRPKLKILANRLAFEVRLSVIYSPSQFYFQYGEASLNTLVSNINNFYSTLSDDELVMSDVTLSQPGLIVAAKFLNIWHRAQIMFDPNMSDKVQLYFVDYGTKESVDVADVRYLLKRFTAVPVKALRGSMVGVVPIDDYEDWGRYERRSFFDTVADKKLFASIVFHRKEIDVYELDLCENANMLNLIASVLIRKGLADPEAIDDSLPFAFPLPIADKTAV